MNQERDETFAHELIPFRGAIDIFPNGRDFISIRERDGCDTSIVQIHPSDVEKVIAALRAAKRAINEAL